MADWPVEWLIRVLVAGTFGVLTLICTTDMVFKTHKKDKAESISRKKDGSDKNYCANIWTHIFKFFLHIAPILFYIMIILFACNGDDFVLMSGDIWLTRSDAFALFFILYVGITMLHKSDTFFHMLQVEGSSSNLSPTYGVAAANLLQSVMALLGLIITASVFKKDHTDGLYGYTIFVWLFLVLVYFIAACIRFFSKESLTSSNGFTVMASP
jgi:hypothetical protein